MVFINPGWQGGDLAVGENEGTLVNLDTEKLRQGLASLGLVIDEEGNLIVKKLIAEVVEARGIKVQDSELQNTGITIFDRVSGEPRCFFIENGEIKIAKGECGVTFEDGQALDSSSQTTPENGSTTEAGATPETTPPEITPETTPEITPEITPETTPETESTSIDGVGLTAEQTTQQTTEQIPEQSTELIEQPAE